jgi:hypothetical protein
MSKLSVCFLGFFGMKQQHANKYIDLWNNFNASTNYYKYSAYKDVLTSSSYKTTRELFEPKKNHYDIVHCISGGSLYLHLLLTSKKTFTYSKIIYDSGPYTFDHKQTEIYAHETFPITKCLPVKNILNAINGDVGAIMKNEHKNTLYNTSHEKLVLTSKLDKTIDREFVMKYIHDSGAKHIEFSKGNHANLYSTNKEEYTQSLFDFIKK